MKNLLLLIIVILGITFTSCKKEEDPIIVDNDRIVYVEYKLDEQATKNYISIKNEADEYVYSHKQKNPDKEYLRLKKQFNATVGEKLMLIAEFSIRLKGYTSVKIYDDEGNQYYYKYLESDQESVSESLNDIGVYIIIK